MRIPRLQARVDGEGKPCALEEIYRVHAHRVGRWVANLGGPAIDVEDSVHDVFLIVQRRLPEFRGDAQITTWLYQITARVVKAARRRERVRALLSRVHLVDLAGQRPGSSSTAIDELERRQARQIVHTVLDQLPEKYRALLVLFELEEMSGEEIAALTGLTLSTVFVRLHRARKLFLAGFESERSNANA
jgi:RNA polymerase sigma-70 factor (ECF subfamily)